jgi:hypothetical protein
MTTVGRVPDPLVVAIGVFLLEVSPKKFGGIIVDWPAQGKAPATGLTERAYEPAGQDVSS